METERSTDKLVKMLKTRTMEWNVREWGTKSSNQALNCFFFYGIKFWIVWLSSCEHEHVKICVCNIYIYKNTHTVKRQFDVYLVCFTTLSWLVLLLLPRVSRYYLLLTHSTKSFSVWARHNIFSLYKMSARIFRFCFFFTRFRTLYLFVSIALFFCCLISFAQQTES